MRLHVYRWVAVLIFVLSRYATSQLEHYRFVRLTAPPEGVYFLHRSKARPVPHPETVSSFGLNASVVGSLDEGIEVAASHPLPLVERGACSKLACSDEVLRVAVLQASIIQDQPLLLHNIRKLGDLLNAPAIVLGQDCFTVAATLRHPRVVWRYILSPSWLTPECQQHRHTTTVNKSLSSLFFPETFLHMAEDIRVIPLDGIDSNPVLAGVYSHILVYGIEARWSMGFVEYRVIRGGLNSSSRVEVLDQYLLLPGKETKLGTFLVESVNTTGSERSDPGCYRNLTNHKNWSPFLLPHGGGLAFIESLNPLHVVRRATNKFSRPAITCRNNSGFPNTPRAAYDYVLVATVSRAPLRVDVRQLWQRWGELRGGTAALRIGHNEWLTFFHTCKRLPGSMRKTYFFGALSFNFSSPSGFAITRISPGPLMEPSLYSGQWVKHRFDYVVYPMSFFFSIRNNASGETTRSSTLPLGGFSAACRDEASRGVDVVLTLGRQDVDSWMVDMHLCSLLESMSH